MNHAITSSRLAAATAAAALAHLALGCGPSGENGGGACEGLLPGDLVISEIMANPAGPDSGKEWFEIYNATSQTLDLTGLTLFAANEDGTSPRTHVMRETVIGAGEYLVLGGVLTEFLLPHMDYGYGSDLGALRNTSGQIALRCGTVEIDKVVYADMADGKAQGFDGNRTPDHIANNDRANWCDQTTEYASGDFGTPGARNDPCANIVPDTCDDGATARPVVSPLVGDLVITEIMASSTVPDADGEWFEVYVVNPVDVNGLQLGTAVGTPRVAINSTDCLRYEAGDYILFARKDDPGVNGGLPPVDFTFNFNLVNSNGSLFIGLDGELLDHVDWPSSTTGTSRQLDPSKFDPIENDDPDYWCAGVDPFGDGDRGTPGAPNINCDIPLEDGKCEDENGVRDIVDPEVGDLVITEIMPDGLGGNPDRGEWFEIYVARDVDLSGVQVGRYTTSGPTTVETLPVRFCNRFTAGSHVLVARSADPLLNGGLPEVDFTFNFVLINSSATEANGALFVRDRHGAFLDTVTWPGSTRGVARQLDPRRYDPEDNNINTNWCPAETPYYDEADAVRLGTPGAENDVECPGVMD
jgi:hypothetical protein